MWSRTNVGWAQAALLFGVCGALSSQLMNLGRWGFYSLPIPFGVVAAWVCVGRIGPGVVLVILDAGVWQLAYRLSETRRATSIFVEPTLESLCLAGLVGRLGVSLATSVCRRRAPTVSNLGMGAITGAVCGLPFIWWCPGVWWIPANLWGIPFWVWVLSLLCFALWQAAAGVCLWRWFRLGQAEQVG